MFVGYEEVPSEDDAITYVSPMFEFLMANLAETATEDGNTGNVKPLDNSDEHSDDTVQAEVHIENKQGKFS